MKDEDLAIFQKELQEVFTKALVENFGAADEGPIPSDEDIQAPQTVIYHILLTGEKAGGVVLRIDNKSNRKSVDFLFISSNSQRRGIGTAAWQAT